MTVEVDELKIAQRLKDDFEHYAEKCLKISTVDGGELIPFKLNKVQKYIHDIIEKQLKDTGKVRVIVLKGRQEGCSTYVEGRFYWKGTHRENINIFILTNSMSATRHLFGMVQKFQDNIDPLFKPSIAINNATELDFDKLGSGYRVSTAGAKGVGRAATLQYVHGSEVAFWVNGVEHMSGLFQAVPDKPNTEIILESTANGAHGLFYDLCMAAQKGESDYLLIFVPWFWMNDYRRKVPKGIEWTTEEIIYKKKYKLDYKQLAWRRNKIKTDYLGLLGGFRREYPASVDEAFKVEIEGSLWLRDDIKRITQQEYNNLLWDDNENDEYNEGKYSVDFIVTGYDPATTGNKTSDEHGVITVSRLSNGMIYVLNDSSEQIKPKNMVPKIITLWYKLDIDRIRVEVNNGGEWIPDAFEMVDDNVLVLSIHAKKNKKIRAGPVAQAYRQEKVIHVGHFHLLEDEMCSWVYGDDDSPNRIDALVYAVLDCLDLDGTTDIPVMWSKS